MDRSLQFTADIQLSSKEGQFNTAPDAVRQWINTLPLAHIGQASRRLFMALNELNRKDLPSRQRFELLQAFEAPLHDIFNAMRPYYLFRTFPLPTKNHRVAELNTDLHRMMLIGYLHITNNIKENGWLTQQVQKRIWINAMSNALQHAEGILLVYHGLGLEAPKNLWLTIHSLYSDVLSHKWQGERSDALNEQSKPPTLRTRYCRLLLLSLLNMQLLHLNHFKKIHAELDDWAESLQLHGAEGLDTRHPHIEYSRFTINLKQDVPPQILGLIGLKMQRSDEPPDLLIDTKKLHERFKRLSTQHDGEPHHQREVLKQMFRSWCEPPRNIETRRMAKMSVELFIGFSNLHRMLYIYELLWGALPVDQQEIDRVLADAGVGVQSNFEEKGIVVEELDPWEASSKPEGFFEMRDKEQIDNDYRKRTAHILELHVVNCKVLNVSDHGYRLAAAAKQIERVSPGELVALRDNHHKGWRIGSVRWVSMADNEHLILGIQVHFERALPLLFRTKNNRHMSDALPCLLSSINGLPVLTLPQIPALSEKQVLLEYNGRQSRIELKGAHIFSTSLFESYNISAGRIKARTQYKGVDLPDLAEMLVNDPISKIDKLNKVESDENRFDEIFSQLR